MKRSHTAAALLILGALLLSGCAKQGNESAPGTEINSSSDFSGSDISNSSSETESSDISSSSEGSSVQSPDVSVEPVPVEFTEEDREVQEILKVVEETLIPVETWFRNDKLDADNVREYEFVFPETESTPSFTRTYYEIPDNYSEGGIIIPHTYDGLRDVMLSCMTEEFTDYLLSEHAAKGSMIENSDGTFTLVFDDIKDYTKPLHFIEINGKMFRSDEGIPRGLIIYCDCSGYAKVSSRTDDTIEFNYLPWQAHDAWNEKITWEMFAIIGELKYERGGWKRGMDRFIRDMLERYQEHLLEQDSLS